jgi:hypothetical protein
MFNKSRNSCKWAKSYYEIICSREIYSGFCIAVLYKDCSLQFAYRGFFRELNNMNLPKERRFSLLYCNRIVLYSLHTEASLGSLPT